MTPNEFAMLLRDQGYPAELSVAGGRIAQILCDSDAVAYTITFLPREEEGSSVDDFVAFTFLARSDLPGPEGAECANVLNLRSRFVRYSANESRMDIEMDVAIPRLDLTHELAMRQVHIWQIALSRYLNAISE